ncbi:hypothetical protein PAUR_a0275 [Pseudoalteromonas aurantia 208]|uniref:Uncharacterized protein n=1 Tax=Pseudoalteromonas aurantia 208 TaxID=1314867 RepID=A0ABR9E7K6_9GAMM|nr:hypothetical protein [Pseudoalteromonas aurantia 208]
MLMFASLPLGVYKNTILVNLNFNIFNSAWCGHFYFYQ